MKNDTRRSERNRFYVTVACHRYIVRIPDQVIYDRKSNELDGLAIESRRLILISPAVSLDRREEVLGHELWHAWEFHLPKPRTAEERCQMAATIMQSLRMDLERQGGIAAIMNQKPEPISLPYSKLCTMDQVAKRWGVDINAVRRMVLSGRLSHVRERRCNFIPLCTVQWAEQHNHHRLAAKLA